MALKLSKPATSPRSARPLFWIWGFIRRDLAIWVLAVPTLVLFVIFNWQPLVENIVDSFYYLQGFNPVHFVGLANYRSVLSNTVFVQTLQNTFIYVAWSLIIGFPLPILSAIAINEMRRAQGIMKFAVYLPAMVPSIVTALMWGLLYQPGGAGMLNRLLHVFGLAPSVWLENSHLTILLIIVATTWGGFGTTTLLYLASLQGVNPELYDAASIDGAGIWKKLQNITIPQIMPIVIILLILQIIGVFQILIQPLAMTSGGPNNASMSMLLLSYYYAFKFFIPADSMAIGVITFVILIGFSFLYFRLQRRYT
jgi:multiple sugar transport system permease protein